MVSVDVDQEVDPWPEDCLFTLEELDRFRGLENLKKSKGQFEPPKAFILPFKADDIALAMVSFGNRFVDARGIISTDLVLPGYMLKAGGKELQMTWDNERDRYDSVGKGLAKRRFRALCKGYLRKD